MSARDRVREYLRQRKLMNRDLGTTVHLVHADPKAEMATLTITDLESLVDFSTEGLRVARAVARWELGDPAWADRLITAAQNPTEALVALQADKDRL